jgi:uroporphyrinogen-III decarboxylase
MSNKNNNLQGLIEGFQANLVYYMSYDKLSKESNQVMNNLEEDPKAFLSFLQKITSSLKYFRRNFDYKGSESYLERYQTLHNNVIHFCKSFCDFSNQVCAKRHLRNQRQSADESSQGA